MGRLKNMLLQMNDAPTEWDEIAAAEYGEWLDLQADDLIDDVNAQLQEIDQNEQE